MTRPCFLTTKGERSRSSGSEAEDLEGRYLDAFTGRFKYDGLPEGCPDTFIEEMIFYYGGVSGKKVKGLGICMMGAKPSALTIYATPARWLPCGIIGQPSSNSVSESVNSESDNPALYYVESMRERISPYLEIMRKAINALNMNMASLSMPIIVEAAPGAELKAKLLKSNLGSGDIMIQAIDKGALGATVLDMKATDHSANLLGVLHDMDSEILDMMHINCALEKTSGISDAESSASADQIRDGLQQDLRMRQAWLDRINPVLGTTITVSCPALDRMEKKETIYDTMTEESNDDSRA